MRGTCSTVASVGRCVICCCWEEMRPCCCCLARIPQFVRKHVMTLARRGAAQPSTASLSAVRSVQRQPPACASSAQSPCYTALPVNSHRPSYCGPACPVPQSLALDTNLPCPSTLSPLDKFALPCPRPSPLDMIDLPSRQLSGP